MKLENEMNIVEGHFRLESKDKNDNVEILVDDKNTIVRGYFNILTGLLTGSSSTYIDTLKLGEGGAYQGALILPTRRDGKLYTPTYETSGWTEILINEEYENSITFVKVIGFDEANGPSARLYSEAGLFAGNTMFARKTFIEQIKTPDREFTVKWTIIFKS